MNLLKYERWRVGKIDINLNIPGKLEVEFVIIFENF